jgi:hypothetical protein
LNLVSSSLSPIVSHCCSIREAKLVALAEIRAATVFPREHHSAPMNDPAPLNFCSPTQRRAQRTIVSEGIPYV